VRERERERVSVCVYLLKHLQTADMSVFISVQLVDSVVISVVVQPLQPGRHHSIHVVVWSSLQSITANLCACVCVAWRGGALALGSTHGSSAFNQEALTFVDYTLTVVTCRLAKGHASR